MSERNLTPQEISDAAAGDPGEAEEHAHLLERPSHGQLRGMLRDTRLELRRRRRAARTTKHDTEALAAAEAKRARKRARNQP